MFVMFDSFQNSFKLNVTDGDAVITMFALDKEPSQHLCTASASVDNAEICLMTPPRQCVSDIVQWTPTANLKLLLKAASPDLHSREVLNDQRNLSELSQPKAHVAAVGVATADDSSMNSNADETTFDEYAENVTVFCMDKRRRKDKSLGSLCERLN